MYPVESKKGKKSKHPPWRKCASILYSREERFIPKRINKKQKQRNHETRKKSASYMMIHGHKDSK